MSAAATTVTFASGTTSGTGVVHAVRSRPEGAIVVVDATPFHPVDHTWPDQPGDAGVLRLGDDAIDVLEAVMVATADDGTMAIADEIPVKRGEPGWVWQVGHRLSAADAPTWLEPGADVELDVDAPLRAALSRGHTACHLASLALDLAVADLWRKDAGTDALGSPDFEGRANQWSRIVPDGSSDGYRLGKSLRKAGFDTVAFADTLAEREGAINAQLARWAASQAESRIETDGPTITHHRRWRCALPEGDVVIPCGGTHVHSLAVFASLAVTLQLTDPQTLVMTTVAVPAV